MAQETKLLLVLWLAVACSGPCDGNPCKDGSTCEPRFNETHVCLCFAGDYNYTDNICVTAKIFPGKLILNDIEYDDKICGFGFSGENCKDAWQLAVVVVGSVLGVTLLIVAIVLPILASKSSKSSKMDASADLGKPYVSHPPAQQPMVNSNFAKSQAASFNGPANGLSPFANAGFPRIPRATTTNSWDSRTNLEMNLSNSRQNLIPAGRNSRFRDDDDDMNPNAQVRPQGGQYAPTRPQNNPYAQNHAQSNPYAQSQGNSNPYYTHDNGRRFN
ncbi:uncharacterized protein LOC130203925 [Pseudoliparis swirei]|uniref:uncharacterized protein LOC130203925 n=1 Tax=Pseudoliparis swirei TaxID=2059687 RepID=UPI0024BDCA63|nr:uncharacterized protein LOC130203925 [Pseudoliparis swirei]